MINWKVRMRNPMFWAQILLSVIMPILAYLGLTAEDLSSWSVLGEVLQKRILYQQSCGGEVLQTGL